MTKPTRETDMNELIAAMVGRSLESRFPPVDNTPGEPVLSIQHLSTKYAPHLQDITLMWREGEIFGLYGLVGAGRTELLETIFGVRTPCGGPRLLQEPAHELQRRPRGHRARLRPHHRGAQGQRPVLKGRSDLQHHHRQPGAVQDRPGSVQAQDGQSHRQGNQDHAHQVHGPRRYDLQVVRRHQQKVIFGNGWSANRRSS